MGLSWTSPAYFLGLLLIALPVLIHLVHRQRHTGFKFPSLMFLKKIPYKEKRILEIRNWWLLMLRCLMLFLIVLAFSRPFFSDGTDTVVLDLGRKDSVIVIDRSYSMRISNHWQQAQEIALKLLDEKSASNRIGVVIFDTKAVVLSDLTKNANTLRAVIKRQSPGLRATHLGVAIEQAARLLTDSDANQKQIHLISDFQATATTSGGVPQIPQNITLEAFQVSSPNAPNTTISSFSVKPSLLEGHNEYALNVQLTNNSSTSVGQQIKLNINGRLVHKRNRRLEPGSVVEEHFNGLSASGKLVRGTVSLDDDALAIDNRVFFVYSAKQHIPVLILEGLRPRVNQSVYLESALRLSRQPVFRVKRSSLDGLKSEELTNWAVIVINDTSIPGGVLGQDLRNFVSSGGGLLVATGDALQGNWPSGKEGFLPGTLLRRVVSKIGVAHTIVALNTNHPLSNSLMGQGGGDLASARIFGYRNLQPNANDRVLGRYTDGGVALLERRVGHGRVLVLTTTLDTLWNDLAVQPVFLPFLHQTMRYLAAFESHPNGFEVGSVVDVMRYARSMGGGDAVVAAADDSTLIIESPSGMEIRLSRQSPLLRLDEQGFYQIHRATPANVEVVLAANINPVEADLKTLDVEKFVGEILTQAVPVSSAVTLAQRRVGEREQQQQMWHVILILVLFIMLVEAFAANRMSRRKSVKVLV